MLGQSTVASSSLYHEPKLNGGGFQERGRVCVREIGYVVGEGGYLFLEDGM